MKKSSAILLPFVYGHIHCTYLCCQELMSFVSSLTYDDLNSKSYYSHFEDEKTEAAKATPR